MRPFLASTCIARRKSFWSSAADCTRVAIAALHAPPTRTPALCAAAAETFAFAPSDSVSVHIAPSRDGVAAITLMEAAFAAAGFFAALRAALVLEAFFFTIAFLRTAMRRLPAAASPRPCVELSSLDHSS